MLDLISEKRALYLRCTKPARFNRNRDIMHFSEIKKKKIMQNRETSRRNDLI